MEEYHNSFSVIPLADYYNRRRDRDGDRIRVHELLDPDIDFDPTQPHDTQRILQGFATNLDLRRRNLAVSFLAGIINSQSDEAFNRTTIDFHILSGSLGTTGLRAVGYLREDYAYPAITTDQPAAWWQIRPIPIDVARRPGQPPLHVTDGFFTRWPSNHDLHRLIADSLTKPE